MIQFDLANVREWAKQAVTEKGDDYVYVNHLGEASPGVDCYNVHVIDGTRVPGCIVGNIIHRAGVNIYSIPMEGDAFSIISILDRTHLVIPGDGIEARRIGWYLSIMQRAQDMGETWGDAYRKAESYLANRS